MLRKWTLWLFLMVLLLSACGGKEEEYYYEITIVDNVTGEKIILNGDSYFDDSDEGHSKIIVFKNGKKIANIGGNINFKVIRKVKIDMK